MTSTKTAEDTHLEIVTHIENNQNRGASKNNKSGIRGVCWHRRRNKWQAYIKVNYKDKHLGYFDDIHDAEKVVIEARLKYMPYASITSDLI